MIMKRILLMTWCLMAGLAMQAQKIDFDFQGKTGSDRYTEVGFLNWPVSSKGTAEDAIPHYKDDGVTVDYPKPELGALPEGMQITVTNATTGLAEGFYPGICSVWAKKNVESNALSKIPGEALSTIDYDVDGDGRPDQRLNPSVPSTLRFTIKGMAAGSHTLLAYHNAPDAGFVQKNGAAPQLKVLVNGVEVANGINQSAYDGTNVQSLDDIASSFISFTAETGQDVVIDYVAVPVEGSANNTVYVNGMVFDAVDPNMKVTNMRPINGNLHVDAIDGTAILSWTGSASAASHRVMFGTSEDNMQEVQNTAAETYTATGLSCLNTYYWRVDEVPAAGEPVLGEVYSFRTNRLAFPGAEGFGRYAIGGRGGQVVHVTSLEDDGTEGTLRWALETVTGPRTVVFDVSGIITINKRLTVNEPYVTIAGQTAPGDGILVRGHGMSLHSEGITRFIRHRMGSVINEDKGTGYSGVDLQGKNNSILDHASIGWATAETMKAAGNYTDNITVQNTMISEALTNDSPGNDGFGYGFDAGGEHGSFHHNLMAHNYYNNMSISGGTDASLHWIGEEEYYNNVAYNWGSGVAGGSASKLNFAANYYKAGPASTQKERLLSINVPKNGSGTIDYYVSGNLLDVNGTITDNPYVVNTQKDEDGNPVEGAYEPAKSETKVVDNGAVYEDAKTAYANVLSQAGASLKRDATDRRIISEVLNGTAAEGENGMRASVGDSDYDIYENVARSADFDANQNGIADWYETATGKTDAQADSDGDGYTNLEDYLNYMATPNQTIAAGETAEFKLNDYFAGISGATFAVEGRGTVEGTTLKVATTADDKGFLLAKVTATSGDVKVTREFNVYLSGTSAGINTIANAKAKVDSYEIYNAAGMLVGQGNGNGAAVDRLPLKGEKNGLYILKIKDTEGRSRSFSVIMK